MENAVDALKIGFGILIFILTLTLLFNTASIARRVSTDLITEADRTTYYTYMDSDMSSVDEKGNRIVTLEDIVPALYRYATESYGVTIIKDRRNSCKI